MADDKKAGSVDQATIEREREWNVRVDWFLQSLVQMVNSSEAAMSFGITLSVGGVLVSGELIGGQNYFEGFGAEFSGGISDAKSAAAVKESFAKMGDIYRQGRAQGASEDEGGASGASYIHLKNARFFQPSGKPIPGSQGVLWRGKLSAVDGFTLGRLKADE